MSDTIKFDMADAVMRHSKALSRQNDDCSCHKHCVETQFPDDPVVAMAYVPFQLDKTTYEPEKALQEGTLFVSLNKPFCGRSVM
jgi:hypothetical protein